MRVSYDREADALYIRLLEDEHECRVVRLSQDVSLDLAAGERLVGVEVLQASELFEDPEHPQVQLEDLIADTASSG
jgi:uncharacterized protein YuzE